LADFVALYRGRTVSDAELVAVSAEPHLVSRFFTELLGKPEPERTTIEAEHATPVLEVVRDSED
jgi:hypothetical protein